MWIIRLRTVFVQTLDQVRQSDALLVLVRGASTALVIQVLGLGLSYLLRVLLARWMGAADYGTYEFIITLATFLAFLAGVGLPDAVLRFIPEYTVQQNWSLLRGFIWGSWWQTLIASLFTVVIGVSLVLGVNAVRSLPLLIPLLLGIGSVPLQALMKLQQEMGRAVRRITLAYGPALVLWPLLILASVMLWRQMGYALNYINAIALSMGVLLVLLLLQLALFRRGLVESVRTVRPTYAFRQWLRVSLPMLLVDGSFVILSQTDTLMVGAMLGTRDVGIYNAGLKTAAWVNFILVAVNSISAPLFAALYAEGDRPGLQHLVSTIARWMFWPALIVALGLIGFGDWVLAWFGPEFLAARWSLAVLAVGQLVNVGAGSVGYLLMMTGHHNSCAFVMGISAILNLGLNFVGIPTFGILGAAIATAISMMIWNIWLNVLVVKYLGINPSIVAALRAR